MYGIYFYKKKIKTKYLKIKSPENFGTLILFYFSETAYFFFAAFFAAFLGAAFFAAAFLGAAFFAAFFAVAMILKFNG